MKTFREIYCENHKLPYERFEQALVFRCLHLPAKLLWWMLWVNRDYYSPDFEFVRSVGDLKSRRDFWNEASDFHYHPRNRGLFRGLLRLRLSRKTLQKIFEREIVNAQTVPPFPAH